MQDWVFRLGLSICYRMSEMFQLIGFEGKGLGAVATQDIKRGTLILKELPQISVKKTNNRNQDINNLKSAFYRMNKINQEEYLSLYCYGFTSKEEKITKIFQFNKFTQRNFGMPNTTEVLYIKGMAIWLVEFSNAGYKIFTRFLPKNQHTHRK